MDRPLRGKVAPSQSLPDLIEESRYVEAERPFRLMLKANPNSAEACRSLGVLRGARGLWGDAETFLRKAAELAPEDPTIAADLGLVLIERKLIPDAVELLGQARRSYPNETTIRIRYARALSLAKSYDQALSELEPCLKRLRKSALIPALRLQGQILSETHREHEALKTWLQLTQLSDRREDLAMLAGLYWHCGATEECLSIARKVIDGGSADSSFHSMYLSARLHSSSETVARTRAAAEEWGRSYPPPDRAAFKVRAKGRKRSRPRIGYVSDEFHGGPAIHFFLPLLMQRDRKAYELVGYRGGSRRDRWTSFAASHFDLWREPATQSELRKVIARDRLDILVDLSGHYGSSLPLFQERCAPAQISFPSYPGTTGAVHMDFILTDRWVCPAGNENQYTESPLWLDSGYLPYRPPFAPRLTERPQKTAGILTFGLFQRCPKITAGTWDAIASILLRTPRSQLLIHYTSPSLDQPGSSAQRFYRKQLSMRGVNGKRIHFRGPARLREHMEILSSVDIALDTFPYNGQTTTCECLWMGVPVITLAGELHVARVGWQTLDRIRTGHLVAHSPREYVEKAVELANDPVELDRLRKGLRAAMRRSPLLDGSVVRGIESAYQGVLKNVV